MKVVTSPPDFAALGGHRTGGIAFGRFFSGRTGSPGNYEFSLTRIDSYSTPRHTHNHDQIRYCLRGPFNYGPGLDIPEDWLLYHPESAPYGPQQVDRECLVLTLQMGGASGRGFMSYDQVDAANTRLRRRGRFADGHYHWTDDAGAEHREDGWDAVWREVTGTDPEFDPVRYAHPVLVNPSAFRWLATAETGVESKTVGVFTERLLTIGFTRLAAGASHTPVAGETPRLGFVRSGRARAAGDDLPAMAAYRLDPGDPPVTIEAVEETVLFTVDLPRFDSPDAY
ncbi:MAG: hypothetical protein ACFCVG_14320 [Kineosporiaceae bacterium]